MRTPTAVVVVWVVTATQLVVSMGSQLLPAIAPKLAETVGVDPVLIGYQVTVMFCAALGGTMLGGDLVRRFGAARTTQLSIGMCALGLAAIAGPGVWWIVAGSVLCGFGAGLVNSPAAEMLVRYTPQRHRNLLFSVKQSGVPLGGMLISLTAPAIALAWGWRWSAAILIGMALLLLVAIQPWRSAFDDQRSAGAAGERAGFGALPLIWRTPRLRWLCLVGTGFGAVQRCLLTFTVVFLVAEAGYGLIEAGLVVAAGQGAGVLARPTWGFIADRIGSSLRVLQIICVVTFCASLALTQLDASWPRPAVYGLFVLFGIASMGWNGVLHAEAARLSPQGMAGAIAGGTTFFVFSGIFIGPTAYTTLYPLLGSYRTSWGLLVILAAVSFILLLRARRLA